MFRPSLSHLQALKEYRSKITQIFVNFYYTFITRLMSVLNSTMRFYKKIYVILDLFSLRA